ncbi:MAG: hypothetical protein OEN55_12595 [Alphaproteobacteria bacterium]|nr:hypothetical protein [Alphaproteobacteria bacterium]
MRRLVAPLALALFCIAGAATASARDDRDSMARVPVMATTADCETALARIWRTPVLRKGRYFRAAPKKRPLFFRAICARQRQAPAPTVTPGPAPTVTPDPAPVPTVLSVQNPRRIATGPAGQILVADRRHGAVIAVDRASLESVWSTPLPAEGSPFGIASLDGLVFVGNTGTKNVEVYRIVGSGGSDTVLEFAYNLGGVPAGATGSIENPIGVGVDANENLAFVLDGPAKRISVFETAGGSFQYAFEPRDSGGLLLSPVSLTVDELRREILVGDYGEPASWFSGCSFCGAAQPARILIYAYSGELLFEIHGDGRTHASARFARVQGMAVSADGRIFAADPLGSRILVFDRYNGALLEELGTQGPAEGQLMLPLDVWLDSETGDLFVSNNQGARRVEVLRGAGGQP